MSSPPTLLPVDEVIDRLLAAASVCAGITRVSLREAAGRILANDVTAAVNVPPAANSSMDGYAVASTDQALEVGAVLPISDRIAAGQTGRPLAPGTAARIFTGAPLPEGADAVVIQEDTERVGDDQVRILERPVAGENVRPMGQDVRAGETLLTAGRRLAPQDVALMASTGVAAVDVFEPLTIAVMSTGDELVDPPGELAPGQIYNSNHYALIGLIEALGMRVVDLGLVPDERAATESALLRGAREADVIVSSGGVSVGEEDHVRAALEAKGQLSLWRIAIKPGKPLAFGEIDDTPFFGLPGNPVSTYVTFRMIATPYLLSLQGASEVRPTWLWAEAGFEVPAGSRREYLRVRLEADGEGNNRVSNFGNQGSGIMSSVSWANALAEVDIGQEVRYGDRLKVYPL